MSDAISVINVRDVLLVTVPPDPTDSVVTDLQQQVLHAMAKFRSTGAVLDISGVEIMDSFFARTLTDTVKMVMVMGGHAIVTGMRPAVAITAMELGLRFDGVMSALTVNRALDLLERINAN